MKLGILTVDLGVRFYQRAVTHLSWKQHTLQHRRNCSVLVNNPENYKTVATDLQWHIFRSSSCGWHSAETAQNMGLRSGMQAWDRSQRNRHGTNSSKDTNCTGDLYVTKMIFRKSSYRTRSTKRYYIMKYWRKDENNCTTTPGQAFKSVRFAVHSNRILVFTSLYY